MSAPMQGVTSHRTAGFVLLVAGLVLPSGMASAQSILENRSSSDSGRYQMQAVEGGIVRLDTRTGTIVLCRTAGDRIVCNGGAKGAGKDSTDEAALQAEGSESLDMQDDDGAPNTRASTEEAPQDNALREPQALQALADRVATLERKIAQLELERGSVDDEAAADAAIDRARKLFRGFTGIMRDFEREMLQGKRGGDTAEDDDLGRDAPMDRGSGDESDPMPGRT